MLPFLAHGLDDDLPGPRHSGVEHSLSAATHGAATTRLTPHVTTYGTHAITHGAHMAHKALQRQQCTGGNENKIRHLTSIDRRLIR